jgi:hypothetical protein
MSHWETTGRMAAEHRADLDREAARAGMAALVKAANPSSRRAARSVIAGWFAGLRTPRPASVRAGTVDDPIAAR